MNVNAYATWGENTELEEFYQTLDCWQNACMTEHKHHKFKCAWSEQPEDKVHRENECKGCKWLLQWLQQYAKPPKDVMQWKEGKPTH